MYARDQQNKMEICKNSPRIDKKVKVISVLLSLLFMSACHKQQVIHVDSDVMANFCYKPGTYWVYKDAITGTIDCLCVRSVVGQNYNVDDKLLETVEINITKYDITSANRDTSALVYQLAQNYLNTHNGFVYYPFKAGRIANPGGGGDDGYLFDIYDHYAVEGQSFTNVAAVSHISKPDPGTTTYYDDTFYINASVGIIKMDLHGRDDTTVYQHAPYNNVWELQRYKVIR